MRLSKPDVVDPNKRRHFEISIDSPFNILSCRATQANTSLPAYSSPDCTIPVSNQSTCGCPGAPRDTHSLSSLPFLGNQSSSSTTSIDCADVPNLPNPPPSAHVHDSHPAVARPMHLLRAPSFNPPAWSDHDPPPPLTTPPPDYDSLIQGDPRSGLADYFARLADDIGDDDDGVSLAARMEIPLTPGGRINRSMDERRTWLPVGGPGTGGD